MEYAGNVANDNPNAFKHIFDAAAVARIASHFAKADPAFERGQFIRRAVDGLFDLELKARVAHIAAALRASLPSEIEVALATLEAALPVPIGDDAEVASQMYLWPLCHFVQTYAVDVPDVALPVLRELTRRFSAEFAIRPFLIAHPEQTFAELEKWLDDPDMHVRRLVSEGTRPLLPWGQRLQALRVDPSPAMPLLEALRNDPAEYVRRSVANHLNDVARDHPSLVVEVCGRWKVEAPDSKERLWMLKRALRTLIKNGDPGALAVVGFGPPEVSVSELTLSATRVVVGESLHFAASIVSTSSEEQRLLVDYLVYFQKKDGSLAPKVFKGGEFRLGAGERRQFDRKRSFREVTTRRLYVGPHEVQLQINGVAIGDPTPFELVR